MRILICGDRNWTDYDAILHDLKLITSVLPKDKHVVIHGDCRGADRLGGAAAESLGFEVVKFPADWNTFGKAAGPLRNQQMLVEGKPEFALVYHTNLKNSKGTKDMVKRVDDANIPYYHNDGSPLHSMRNAG